jgi:hypothetical protein
MHAWEVQRAGHDSTAFVERVKGIEPSYAAWEAAVLPLNYTRNLTAILPSGVLPYPAPHEGAAGRNGILAASCVGFTILRYHSSINLGRAWDGTLK